MKRQTQIDNEITSEIRDARKFKAMAEARKANRAHPEIKTFAEIGMSQLLEVLHETIAEAEKAKLQRRYTINGQKYFEINASIY